MIMMDVASNGKWKKVIRLSVFFFISEIFIAAHNIIIILKELALMIIFL